MKYELDKISERLKERRESLGLKQQYVGEKLHISFNQVSRHERNAAIPTLDLLLKYCEIYDCELGYLLGEEDYTKGTKLDTEIEKKTGLTPETTFNIRNAVRRRILPFDKAVQEKRVLNAFLSNTGFEAVLECMCELDACYDQYANHKPAIISNIDQHTLDIAMDAYNSPVDYLHDPNAPKLNDEVMDALAAIEKQIDAEYSHENEYEYAAKVRRYELSEAFRNLINNLYPLY